jgi:hypothetical protein
MRTGRRAVTLGALALVALGVARCRPAIDVNPNGRGSER